MTVVDAMFSLEKDILANKNYQCQRKEQSLTQFKTSIHIFRRDLRLKDNTSLIYALQNSEQVIPLFIFNPQQIENNPYRSDNALTFMLNSLQELNQMLQEKKSRLYIYYGEIKQVLCQIFAAQKIDALVVNLDYSPFSRQRDREIKETCLQHGVYFKAFSDLLLTEPQEVLKKDGAPYRIFTPFYNKAQKLKIKAINNNHYQNYYQQELLPTSNDIIKKIRPQNNKKKNFAGGSKEGYDLLQRIKELKDYESKRDYPALAKTSFLSPHNKFGTISIREFASQIVDLFGSSHPLLRQLYWRDFYTHMVFHFPDVLGNAFQEKYRNLIWENDKEKFERWCQGQTGYPIIDAGMRQLNQTGWLHNRVRMLVSSFLIKNLLIDWRWGEQYFAQNLVDYDVAINNGNWQWVASTGSDAQPYFRIFNPLRQTLQYDKEQLYIKKWVDNYEQKSYPQPMVDLQKSTQQAKAFFKKYIN